MELKIPERRVMTAETTGQPVIDPGALQAEYAGMGEYGRTLQNIGTEIGQKVKTAERAADTTTSVNQYRLNADEYIRERGQDSSKYSTFEEDFVEKQKEFQGAALEGIDDEVVKASITEKLNQLNANYQIKVRQTARTQQISVAQTSTNKALSVMSRRAVEEDDPTEMLEDMQDFIKTQTIAGIYSPEKAAKLLNDTRNDVYVAKIKRDMAADPETTYHNLIDPEYYPDLPEDKRGTLTEQARKRAETKAKAEERERLAKERKEDKELKKRQDFVAGLGYSMLQENKLDDVWLEDQREKRFLTSSDYKSLKDALNKAQKTGGVTDPDVYNAVINQVYGGTMTLNMLYNQVGEGLTFVDVKELTPIIQEGGAIFKTKDYQEARNFVRESMGITGFGFMKADDGPKVASASRELYERVKSGADPMKTADDIVARYNKRVQGLPSARAFPDKSKPELMQMLKGGKITSHQYNTESALIEKETKQRARSVEQEAKKGTE